MPILWEDNYFSMLPGEERSVTAAYDVSILRGKDPDLEVDGFNVVSSSRQVNSGPILWTPAAISDKGSHTH